MSALLPICKDYEIESANYITCINPMFHPDRIMPYHDFLYIIDGEWEIIEDDVTYKLQTDDLLILVAGRHHYSLKPCSPNNRHMYIHVCESDKTSEDITHSEAGETKLREFSSQISCRNNPKIKRLFEDIISVVWSEDELKKENLSFLFGAFLCELYKQQNSGRLQGENIVGQTLAIMQAEPHTFYSCSDMANRFFICERTLNNLFKKSYDKTFFAYQMDRKLEMVRQYMLVNPEAKLSEVAGNFGFCDEFHLGKAYKKKYGISPKRHIKKM
ncbi:MAG: helix-turn-helix transcriptional regulator [Lachnospiraceae bacterium]|nr:helix-turn-helix transcriptional regulator [Lachnospiraceae bacterium]